MSVQIWKGANFLWPNDLSYQFFSVHMLLLNHTMTLPFHLFSTKHFYFCTFLYQWNAATCIGSDSENCVYFCVSIIPCTARDFFGVFSTKLGVAGYLQLYCGVYSWVEGYLQKIVWAFIICIQLVFMSLCDSFSNCQFVSQSDAFQYPCSVE
jgi:hypothetical protein